MNIIPTHEVNDYIYDYCYEFANQINQKSSIYLKLAEIYYKSCDLIYLKIKNGFKIREESIIQANKQKSVILNHNLAKTEHPIKILKILSIDAI